MTGSNFKIHFALGQCDPISEMLVYQEYGIHFPKLYHLVLQKGTNMNDINILGMFAQIRHHKLEWILSQNL